ncbi:hypothetical protein ACOXXX_19250 [Thalassococcus sp. BH17M4-6]|uniref:hypothetical protein n=1 Tax=Thalassococcus sp. BH17M4-6 TaxID=3413148 RepID=UPI003BBECEED
MAPGPMPRKGKGPLQLLKAEVERHVLPALAAEGFAPDESLRHAAGWDGEGYSWYFRQADGPWRLCLETGRSRDPRLRLHRAGPRQPSESDVQDLMKLDNGPDAVAPVALSPWESWSDPVSACFAPLYRDLETWSGAKRYAMAPLWLLQTLLSLLWFPIGLIIGVSSANWVGSDAARSGARQTEIATAFARRIKGLGDRLNRRTPPA